MREISKIVVLVLLSSFCIVIESSHFNGGTITWAPIDPTANSSTVDITITQKYSWSYPLINCTTNVPVTSGRSSENLTCVANCSTDGGYSSSPIDILTDCTFASTAMSTMTSERSVNITLSSGAYFYIAYTGSAWRDLYSPLTTGLGWSIVTLIDLRPRSDGIINTPPVADVMSPQYVTYNTTAVIDILASDVNVGDDVRCRWAVNNGTGSINECSTICYPRGLPNDTTLSNCTITFTGLTPGTWYTIAIQVEDFINDTSTEPMSSVPVQFLVYVPPIPVCSIAPVVGPMTDCTQLEAGVAKNLTLYIYNLCNSSAAITDLIVTKKISGMTVSNVLNTSTGSLAYVTLTWTPQSSQVGSQQLCAYAYNSLLVRSTTYCVTFTVITSTPICPTTIAAVATTSATPDNNGGISIPLIVGLSLLGLLLSCCCFCSWLYYFCRGARRRHLDKYEHQELQESRLGRFLSYFYTRKQPPKAKRDNAHSFERISNKTSRVINASNSSSPMDASNVSRSEIILLTNNQIRRNGNNYYLLEESMKQNRSLQTNQSFTKSHSNKISMIHNDAQSINNTVASRLSHSASTNNKDAENSMMHATDTSALHLERLNTGKPNRHDIIMIEKVQDPVESHTDKERKLRILNINASVGGPSNKQQLASKSTDHHTTIIRRLSNNKQPLKRHDAKPTQITNNEHNTIHNTTMPSVTHKKSKSQTRKRKSFKIHVRAAD